MAAEQPARSEFESILSCINRKFTIISTKWSDDKNFEAKFRTSVPRDNEDYNALCDEYVDLFSAVTSTTWVKKISNTGPQIRFRKQYQCWTHLGEVQKELLFDPRKCKATLDVKVLTDNEQTRRKNKFIKQGLNAFVKLNFTHLHPATLTKPFAYFVHTCDPQPEPPKLSITPNENIPQIINNIVTKLKSTMPQSQRVIVEQLNNSTVEPYQSNEGKPELETNPPQYQNLVLYQQLCAPNQSQVMPMFPYTQGTNLTTQNESNY